MDKIPTELLFLIAEDVAEASDLLSLGSTCKRLAKVILPTYYSYHTICAPLEHTDLWIHFLMNPDLCWYVRHLQVTCTRGEVANTPTRRLPPFNVIADHPFQKPENQMPLLWSFELLGSVLRRMVNLKSLEWSHDKTPIFDTNSDIGQEFPNLRILERLVQSEVPMLLDQNNFYVSIFDAPIIRQTNLVNLCLASHQDALDSGNSIVDFLSTCLELKYLTLRMQHQASTENLLTLCRWPKLQVLSLNISRDYSLEPPTEDSIRGFLDFHSNIVSLEWYVRLNAVDQDHPVWLPIPPLPHNYLPHLRSLDCDENFFQSISSSHCVPRRPLEKIIGFPSNREFWNRRERTFRGLSRSNLRIVVIPARSIGQLLKFSTLFPGVEYLDITGSFAEQTEIKPSFTEMVVNALSSFKRLRVLLGMRFWGYDDIRETQGNDELFRSIHAQIPQLEFCATDKGDQVVFTREGEDTVWHWVPAPPVAVSKFAGRERDFMIDEEYERFRLY